MRNIKITLAYDGTDFSGWQTQKRAGEKSGSSEARRTVQGELEKALCLMHKHNVAVSGAGRTDAGVHARAQVAAFLTDIERIKAENFVPALNSLLPNDIRILQAEEASTSFHARFDAKARLYRYRLIAGRQALPQERRYALQLWRVPDISALNDLACLLRGEIDCTIFASPRDKSLSRFRYINFARFFVENSSEGHVICFEISANAFLWKMVRSITGSLLFYEERRIPRKTVADYIASGKRSLAGPTAPPQGLTLWNVEY